MEYTKGKWEVVEFPVQGHFVVCEGIVIATIHEDNDDAEANAHLIAAAVNACIKLNPDNPMAVAESISDLYEACKSRAGYRQSRE